MGHCGIAANSYASWTSFFVHRGGFHREITWLLDLGHDRLPLRKLQNVFLVFHPSGVMPPNS